MPLPDEVERSAIVAAAIAAAFENRLAAHIANGTAAPSVDAYREELRPHVVAAYRDALVDVTPGDLVDEQADAIEVQAEAMADEQLEELARQATAARNYATEARVDVLQAARIGATAGAALALLRKRVGALRAAVADRARAAVSFRDVSAALDRPAPASLGPRLRTAVRTGAAIGRNRWAANLADRAYLVVYVEDALFGDTDRECEDVDGRYATPSWLRANTVEHPNCTRRGTPMTLPRGARVTLV